MNLFLALLWLVAAVVILGMDYVGHGSGLRVRGTNWSLGWLLLVMAVYNLARWRSLRSYHAAARAAQATRPYRRPPRRTEEPPDPNFDFTRDEPPAQGP
jgi:hypothetical protein